VGKYQRVEEKFEFLSKCQLAVGATTDEPNIKGLRRNFKFLSKYQPAVGATSDEPSSEINQLKSHTTLMLNLIQLMVWQV
jgi:hypothetical protein